MENIPELKLIPFDAGGVKDIIGKLHTIPYLPTVSPQYGISPEEAQSLVNWTVAGAATWLEKIFPRNGRNWNEVINKKCALASAAICDLTKDLPKGYVRNFNMSILGGIPHAAIIMHLPIKEENRPVRWQHFLLDVTLGQFFNGNKLGERFASTGKGEQLARQLLTHGNVELTEETAKLYVEAFAHGYLSEGITDRSDGSYIKLLCHDELKHDYENGTYAKFFKQPPGRGVEILFS